MTLYLSEGAAITWEPSGVGVVEGRGNNCTFWYCCAGAGEMQNWKHEASGDVFILR